MGRFEGIKSKTCKLAAVVLIGGVLTGCTADQLGSVRPEINNANALILYPDSLGSWYGYQTDTDGSDTGGSSTGEDSATGGTVIGNAAYFDVLPYNVMSAPDYNKYLEQEVFQKISAILNGLEGDAASHLYFRVFHSGYTTVADDSTAIQVASIYDNRMIGSGTILRGTVFPNLAYYWLGQSKDNLDTIARARESYLKTINNSGISPTATWMDAAASGMQNNSSYSQILRMWGNERFASETLQDHLDEVRHTVIGTVPNINLKVLLANNSSTYVQLNNLFDISGSRYYDHMSKLSVDRLFGSYNQYRNREKCKYDLAYSDDYGMLFSYIDGYSKTIVALCCFDGYTLDNTLGEQRDDVEAIFSGIYDYTQWAEISEFVEGATILQAGTRGMN